MKDNLNIYDEAGLRLGQRVALRTILRRLGDGASFTAIVMATRYGKSDLLRIATIAAVHLRLACCAICLSPNDYLADQMNSQEKWDTMCERLKIHGTPKHARISECVEDPTVNGEIFLSCTIQFFHSNKAFWVKWAKFKRRQSGLPVLLFVDECQTTSEKNEWGADVEMWQRETSGHVTLCTATAERTDEHRISGFNYKMRNVQAVEIRRISPTDDPEKILIDVYDAKKAILEIEPHEKIDFEQAWREKVLCHIDFQQFEIDLRVVLGGAARADTISQIKDQREIRRALSGSIRHSLVINAGLELSTARLNDFRLIDPTCAMIIFCGNDFDESSSDKHAKDIKNRLTKINPALRVIVATSNNEGKDELTAFNAGQGDVLIVKQMAALGLDISRLKIGLDLSPTRTTISLIQRMMRIATPHPIPSSSQTMLMCAWYTPKDLLSEAIFKSTVADNGGQATITDLEWLRCYEKDVKDSPEKPKYTPTDAYGSGARDTRGNVATESELGDLRSVLDLVPEARAFVSEPELVKRQRERTQQHGDQTFKSESTSDTKQKLKDEINDLADAIIKEKAPRPYTQRSWQDTRKAVWYAAKAACGIDQGLTLAKINDLRVLQRLRDYFKSIR